MRFRFKKVPHFWQKERVIVEKAREFKKVNLSFQANLLLVMVIHIISLFIAFITFSYLNYTYHSWGISIVLVTSGFLLFIFGLTFILFYKNVYIPIMKIEKALKIMKNSETDFTLDTEGDIAPLMDGLSKMLKQLKESMNREHATEILKRQSEFVALQSQINPHFLYNTLEAIRGEALLNDNLEIAGMIEALARFFRYSISKKGDLVTLRDELSNVQDYIMIQQYRFDDKLSFEIKYDDVDKEVWGYKIPKLTIQPIIENSIYHGLETKMGEGKITIRITDTDKRLIINIADNGLGMDKETLEKLNYKLRNSVLSESIENIEKHSGIALVNANQRLRLYFGEEFGITLSSTLSLGTDVEIVLPVLKDEDGVNKLRAIDNEKGNIQTGTYF
jgi:two-component system, sensor histidine kinase YesM